MHNPNVGNQLLGQQLAEANTQKAVDLSQISWKDTDFLFQFGLTEQNVLDYFSRSPFYDPASVPEQLKMQARFTEHLSENKMDRSAMTGVDYIATSLSLQPSLFVVTSIFRKKNRQPDILQGYYILEGTIYQSPDLFSLIGSRLYSSLQIASDALAIGTISSDFDFEKGFSWKQSFDETKKNDDDESDLENEDDLTRDKNEKNLDSMSVQDESAVQSIAETSTVNDKFNSKRLKKSKSKSDEKVAMDPTETSLILGSSRQDTQRANFMIQELDHDIKNILDQTMSPFFKK